MLSQSVRFARLLESRDDSERNAFGINLTGNQERYNAFFQFAFRVFYFTPLIAAGIGIAVPVFVTGYFFTLLTRALVGAGLAVTWAYPDAVDC